MGMHTDRSALWRQKKSLRHPEQPVGEQGPSHLQAGLGIKAVAVAISEAC